MASQILQLKHQWDVRNYFSSRPHFKYVTSVGLDNHGGALLFKELMNDGSFRRNFIVKFSLGTDDSDDQLRNEAGWLRRLRGCEHIVRLFDMEEASLLLPSDPRLSRSERVRERLDMRRIFRPRPRERRPTRPTIAMEYVPSGTVGQWRFRMSRAKRRFPNRVLWNIFLCLIRQCVAMAYPPDGRILRLEDDKEDTLIDENTPAWRERILAGVKPFTLIQGSPHLANVLIDNITSEDEHRLVPMIKLIDFGRGQEQGTSELGYPDGMSMFGDENGIRRNIWGVGRIMQQLACTATIPQENSSTYDGSRQVVTFTSPVTGIDEDIYTEAVPALISNIFLEPRLREMIIRCLAWSYIQQPLLHDILETCENMVRTRTAQHYDILPDEDAVAETDEGIKKLVQEMVLDSDVMDFNVRAR
ncbi:hypothetical protein F5B20DRAFT_552830 [Whalleya microplaca]|nr:hypothetical protein F5B20DRAFT_552830 [Whalleya microplaca]